MALIASLTGHVIGLTGGSCLLEVGGVGFEIKVPLSSLATLAEAKGEVRLYTYLYLREDGVQLFGFLTPEEKQVFLQLIGITGVGPKMALSLLSVLGADGLCQAVVSEDHRLLATVPGIGPKTAQRLIFELRGKLKPLAATETGKTLPAGTDQEMADAVEALVALGYSTSSALAAVEAAAAEGVERKAPTLVRAALKRLAK